MKRSVAAVLGVALLAPAAASADGLPIMGVDGRQGVVSRDGGYRYVTFPNVDDNSTLVARVHTQGGEIARHRTIAGRFTVPVVAYDGSTDGLSGDAGRLFLIRPRTGLAQKRTRLAILDTRLQVRKQIVLQGDFSFDALSPDGSTAYLIEYLSLSRHNFDPSNYRVRVLDTASGRLLHAPIVDPREPDEKMGGLPITRTMSPDGRWAYTLYSGSEHPFVHALDTTGRAARCIDLDALTGREDLFQLRLRVTQGGGRLDIVKGDTPMLLVDTHSFAVSEPRTAPQRAARPATKTPDDGTSAWPWVAGAAALLVLLGVASARPLARAARAR
ncbi:MAG TPA: hypothetical protein VF066_12205 [Thermoleophilaceae bacterium]